MPRHSKTIISGWLSVFSPVANYKKSIYIYIYNYITIYIYVYIYIYTYIYIYVFFMPVIIIISTPTPWQGRYHLSHLIFFPTPALKRVFSKNLSLRPQVSDFSRLAAHVEPGHAGPTGRSFNGAKACFVPEKLGVEKKVVGKSSITYSPKWWWKWWWIPFQGCKVYSRRFVGARKTS